MSVRKHTFGQKVSALRKAMEEIGELLAAANSAENYQARASNLAKQCSVGWDRYGNREVSSDLVGTAKAINERVAEEFTAEFKARRDAEIARLSAQIDSARIALPDLAAKACVELGILAREMKEENVEDHQGH